MQFSKIKKNYLGFLAPSLQGRFDLYSGIYRKAGDGETFVAFTFDGKEICRVANIPYELMHSEKYEKARVELPPKPEKFDITIFESEWYKASDSFSHQIDEKLNEEGIFDVYNVLNSLMEYPHLSIEVAMNHRNSFIRGLTFFDRRLGKRRLASVNKDLTKFELLCYNLRIIAEAS